MPHTYSELYYSSKRFHTKMIKYLDEYKDYLLHVKSDGTSVSHGVIIHQFINFILNHHLISSLDQITVSICNSKFQAEYKKLNKIPISVEEMKPILKGFFTFIYGKYGVKNEKVMKGLQRRA